MRALLLLLLGCGGPASDREDVRSDPAPLVELPDGSIDDGGEATAPTGEAGRDRHRMSVPQLADSLETVTGIRWMVGNDDGFEEEFAATLGVPDWIETTTENRTPDLVFNKILEDAASEVCLELVQAEAGGGDRLLVGVDLSTTVDTDRAAIEAAMSAALLRFHGRVVPVGDARLGPWVWLLESATNATDGDTSLAWRGVCTALIVHPDFYTY